MLARDHSNPTDIVSWLAGFLHFVRNNWRIALGGIVLAAGVAATLLYMLPTNYRSQASLPLTVNARVAMNSTAFLATIASKNLASEFNGNLTAAVFRLRGRLGSPKELDRATNLYRVELTWEDPRKAKEILTSIVNEALKWSRPTGSDREARVDEIKTLENNIPNLRKLYSQLSAQVVSNGNSLDPDRIPTTLFAIENDLSQKEARLASIKRSLDGTTPEDVLEWPSDPERTGGRLASAAMAAIAIISLTALLLSLLYQYSLQREQRRTD